jgi:hypothetical protein
MRLLLIPVALLCIAVAAPPARAQAALLALRGKFLIPGAVPGANPSASPAGASNAALRGPLNPESDPSSRSPSATPASPAAVAPPIDQTPAPALAGLSRPGRPFAGGLTSGLAPPSALPGLPLWPSVGDAAPICRATCAKTRIFCDSADSEGCTDRWVQCVAGCAADAPG